MADSKTRVGKVRSVHTEARKRIAGVALQVLERNPGGLRHSELADQVAAELPQYSYTTVVSVLPKLTELTTGRVVKPSRGLYCLQTSATGSGVPSAKPGVKERSKLCRPVQRSGSVNRVRTAALEILRSNPVGLRYGELASQLANKVADAANTTILRVVSDLPKLYPTEVEQPDRGLYRYRSGPASASEVLPEKKVRKTSAIESDFYANFADWLKHETEECSIALPLGGCKFGGKWGTPDVIGILKKKSTDPVDFPTEIVSAEIKLDDAQLIIAFGQACAYRLFSHKSYLVVPKKSQKADVDKLDSLCMVLGVGLVLFDSSNPEKPNFEIRVRPVMHAPDMYYANLYLKQVEGLW
jgi:hypothetical protein